MTIAADASGDGLPTGLACHWKRFDALTLRELHDILRLRVQVFVVEQACAYAEIDGLDPDALHLLLTGEKGELAAYLRLLRPLGEASVTLGRIVVAPAWRGRRLGGVLLRQGLAKAAECYPGRPVELSAQAHLRDFYAAHGFVAISDIYVEDGIPHVAMRFESAPPVSISDR